MSIGWVIVIAFLVGWSSAGILGMIVQREMKKVLKRYQHRIEELEKA